MACAAPTNTTIGSSLTQSDLNSIRVDQSGSSWEIYTDIVTSGDYSVIEELLLEYQFPEVHEIFLFALKYSEKHALDKIVSIVFSTDWCESQLHCYVDPSFHYTAVDFPYNIRAPWLWIEEYCRRFPSLVNELHPNNGLAPMHLAFTDYNGESVLWRFRFDVLLEHGADVNVADRYGATPLHHAAAHGFVDVCEYLVEKGAKKDFTDGSGRTPADTAFLYGKFGCVRVCAVSITYKIENHDCVLCCQEASKLVDHFKPYKNIYCTRSDVNHGEPGVNLAINEELEEVVSFESIQVHNVPREVDVDTMLNHLQHSCHGFRNVFLQPTKTREIKAAVSSFVEALLEKVAEAEPLLQFEMCVTGSSVQGGKVSLPDEFDINCVLVSLSKYCKPELVPGHEGYAAVKLDRQKSMPPEFLRFFDEATGDFDVSVVAELFNHVFILAIHKFYYEGFGNPNLSIQCPSLSSHVGPRPVYELEIYWDDFDLRHLPIKIDIAFLLEVVGSEKRQKLHYFEPVDLFPNKQPFDRCFLMPMKSFRSKELPKAFCRISFTLQENAIFEAMPAAAKDAYGLLKAMVSRLSRTNVSFISSSYLIYQTLVENSFTGVAFELIKLKLYMHLVNAYIVVFL